MEGNALIEMDFYRAVEDASRIRRMTRNLRATPADSDYWSSDDDMV